MNATALLSVVLCIVAVLAGAWIMRATDRAREDVDRRADDKRTAGQIAAERDAAARSVDAEAKAKVAALQATLDGTAPEQGLAEAVDRRDRKPPKEGT